MDPEKTYRYAMDLLVGGDTDGFANLWHEDGVLEFPFAPADMSRRVEGRAAVAAYMRALLERIDLRAIPYLEIHRTEAPGRIVAEMRSEGRQVDTGDAYEMSYIAVVDVEDGLIVRYRDYWNPLNIPASMRGAA